MNHDPARRHRRSIRLPAYDYAGPGAYFITLVAHARECLFGQVIDGEMRLNALGKVVAEEWQRTADVRREVELDVFVVMPNHAHGIVVFNPVGAHGCAPLPQPFRPPRLLGSLVAGFKSAATRRINEIRGTPGLPVWQRNYHEHVIRNQEDLDHTRRYIAGNPTCWDQDRENPSYRPRDDQHLAAEAFQPRRQLPVPQTESWYNARYNGHDSVSHPKERLCRQS